MKKQLRELLSQFSGALGNRMVESPTLMDRWRITVLGKPVLSLPIKEPSEYPSSSIWKCIRQQGKREKLVFCSVQEVSEEGSVLFCSVLFKRFLKKVLFCSVLFKRFLKRVLFCSVLFCWRGFWKNAAETSLFRCTNGSRYLFRCNIMNGKELESF